MRLLITRPQRDAEPLAEAMADLGHDCVIAPLFEIEFFTDAAPDLAGAQALLFTSANGVRAFAAAHDARALPVYAVGDATAREAAKAGFTEIESAAGDVGALAGLVAGRLEASAGALLHVAGSAVAGDLAGALDASGFTVKRAVLYAATPVAELPSAAADALRQGVLDAAAFFSPRTAASFARLTSDAGLADRCGRLVAFCLSPAVATAAGALDWRAIVVAERPDHAAMVDVIRRGFPPS